MNKPIKRRSYLLKRNEKETIQPNIPLSFDEAERLFLLDLREKNLSVRTLEFHETNLYSLQKALMDKQIPIDLHSITYNDIKHHFIGGMLEQKLAGNTINGRIKSCKAFFAFLYRENLIQNNLAEHFVLVKSEKKMISTFSKHQIINLLQQPDRNTFVGLRDYTMMLILLETGLRLNELLNLRVEDIRWADNEIYVYQGKGNKTRRVPFQNTCANAIRQYLKERGDVSTDVLFVTVNHTPVHPRTFQDNLTNYGKSAGLRGVRVSPHTFRHTMAKFYILNGGDAFTLQQILGHSTLDMVRHYVQLFRSDIQEQHRKFSPVENMKF